MQHTARPPSRVSKACDRCRNNKKRCDFERPCHHCLHAQTECTTSTPPTSKKRPLWSSADVPTSTRVKPRRTAPPEAASSECTKSPYRDPEVTSRGGSMLSTPRSLNHVSPGQSNQQEGPILPDFKVDSALAITRKIFRSQVSSDLRDRATSAIPGGRYREGNSASYSSVPSPLIPIVDIIGIELPSAETCDQLLESYFSAVHWFSLVVYEPKFRPRFITIVGSGLASRSDHGFLLLLLMVLIMGCWYIPEHKIGVGGPAISDTEILRRQLLAIVQRDFMELMDEDSIEFVQLCALLGSFYLYHGRPRSSFSMLGAAIKTSQAMDLHRESDMRISFEDREERKRAWWTIYTWDRFATITYGRPFAINDRDCNVSQPSEIFENVHSDATLEAPAICLSHYQYHLNLVYKIASPLLEDIYGMRTLHDPAHASQIREMVAAANQGLLQWQQDVPSYLSYENLDDLTLASTTEEKARSLQALSLQLTYDNLMIVLHRPLLVGQGSTDPSISTGHNTTSREGRIFDDMRIVSFKRCLSSALRISNLQRKANLFSLARTTHLVSFLGMNLFTASVVLFICALSDTLSDTAQEAKRGLKRTLQMQKALSNHASLSMQCSSILEDLVQLILRKEMEEMLNGGTNPQEQYTAFGGAMWQEVANRSNTHDEITAQAAKSSTFEGENASDWDDLHLKQSLRTLQRVFHDSSLLRYPTDNTLVHSRSGSGQFTPVGTTLHNHNNVNADLNGGDGGTSSVIGTGTDSILGGFNAGDYSRVEDIGQFWLWDVDDFRH